MIFDSIQNKRYYHSEPLIYKALEFLESITSANIPEMTVNLGKEILFANPIILISKPEEEGLYEAHNKYVDIHYIIEGEEGIATANRKTLNTVVPYNEQTDIGFYEGKKDGQYYLKPGQFMVCFPNDAHKVAIMKDSPSSIKKMVVKIRVKELNI